MSAGEDPVEQRPPSAAGASARSGRLSRSAEFQRVYRQGRSHANRQLVLYAFANPADSATRLGLSVSRKVGGAVERNRVKRLLREAFASLLGDLSGGQDVVVVARPAVLELAERDGLAGVRAALSELLVKAGMLAAEQPEQPEHAAQQQLAALSAKAQP